MNYKLSHGFTLIEMLVVVAIMSILIVIGTNVFISILRSNNKSLILTQVREEGSKAMDLMARSFQNAQEIVDPVEDSPGNPGCSQYVIVKNKVQSADLTFSQSVGQKAYTRIGFEPGTSQTDGNNFIALNSADTLAELQSPAFTSPTSITNTTGTAAVNVDFIKTHCFNVRHLKSDPSGPVKSTAVIINFTLTESNKVKTATPNRNEYVGSIDFQSTYTIRAY